MKKATILIVVLTLVLFVSSAAFADNIGINLGFDFGGTYSIGSESTNSGIVIGAEYLFTQFAEFNLDYGFGLEYQFSRSRTVTPGDFNFIPIYATGTYYFKDAGNDRVTPFVTARLGYDLFSGDNTYKGFNDLTGGIYFAVGGGVYIGDIGSVKLLYDVNNGSRGDTSLTYSKLRLLYSYQF